VQRLAGVLLQVQAFDADRLRPAVGQIDDDLALAHDRLLVLRDLIAEWQVGVEIILPREDGMLVDLRLQREPRAHGLAHALLVEHRQHARHGRVDEAHLRVGRRAEIRRRAREQLRLRDRLGVHLEPDHHFPVARPSLQKIRHLSFIPIHPPP
jgi:hypothetical protein